MNTYTYEGTFTDSHGVTHNNPVFIITSYNQNCSMYMSGNLNREDNFNIQYTEDMNSSKDINYSLQFWTNAQARTDGFDPILFRKDGNSSFYFTPEDELTTHEDIRNACFDHLANELLVDSTPEE